MFAERLEAVLPQDVRIHRFREPDETNLAALTVKLATAMGILTLRHQHMAPTSVRDDRELFKFRVGRGKRGQLLVVLNESSAYDQWSEMGACTRPEVRVLYISSQHLTGSEIAADDPNMSSVLCNLGYDAVGYRVYLRAVSSSRLEIAVGPPGGRPDEDAPRFAVDLNSASCEAVNVD